MTVQFNAVDLGGNSIATASLLDPGLSSAVSVSDTIGTSDRADYYRVVLSAATKLDLSLSILGGNADLKIYRADGLIAYWSQAYAGKTLHLTGSLAADTYYIAVASVGTNDSAHALKLSSTSVGDGTAGHGLVTATSLGTLSTKSTVVTDRIDVASGNDYYSFTLGSTQTVNLRLFGFEGSGNASVTILDGLGRPVYSYPYTSTYASAAKDGLFSGLLAAGTYYVAVDAGSRVSSDYSLAISTGAATVGGSTVDQAGGSISTAKSLGVLTATGTSVADYVGGSDVDIYKIELSSLSRLNLALVGTTGNTAYAQVAVTDSKGTVLYSGSGESVATGYSSIATLAKGVYYVKVTGSGYNAGYNLRASATALPDAASKTSTTPTSLGALGSTATVRQDWVGAVAQDDFYSFTLSGSRLVTLDLASANSFGTVQITLTDQNGTMWGSESYSGYDWYNNGDGSSLRTNGVISRVLPSGTYKVQIHTDESDAAYRLSAVAAASPDGSAGNSLATATALGPLTSTPIVKADWTGQAAPSDYYAFSLGGYSAVTLRLSDFSAARVPVLRLLDGSGNFVVDTGYWYGTGDEAVLRLNLAGGSYYAMVDNSSSDPSADGTYTLSASATPASAGAGGKSLALATALPGGIGPVINRLDDIVGGNAGSDDWYSFTTNGGQTLNFLADVETGYSGSVFLSLYNAIGDRIAYSQTESSEDSPQLTVSGLAAGTYYLNIDTYSRDTPYSLSYWTGAGAIGNATSADAAGNSFATAKVLGTLSGTPATAQDWVGTSGSRPDSVDYYQFTVTDRSKISFITTAKSSGISNDYMPLSLYDGVGNLISGWNRYGDGSTLSHSLDLNPGTYYVKLAAPNGGSIGYSLSAVVDSVYTHTVGNDFYSAGSLGAVGPTAITVSGLGDAARGDLYSFALGSASHISLSVSSAGVGSRNPTARIQIFDAGGVEIGSRTVFSDAGEVWKLNLGSGLYYVRVEETSGVAYQLSLSGTAPASLPRIDAIDSLGTLSATAVTATGWVGGGGVETRSYSFSLAAASRLNIRSSLTDTGSVSPKIAIYDAAGNAVSGDLAAGTYTLRITAPYSGNSDQYANYAIALSARPVDGTAGGDFASATALSATTSAQTVTDWVGVGKTRDVYKITLASKQVLNLRMTRADMSGLSDVYVTYDLLDASGNTLLNDVSANSGGRSTSLAAGTYYVAVDGRYGSYGYALTYWTGAVQVGTSAKDGAGNSTDTALSLGTLTTSAVTKSDWLGGSDSDDYYKFALSKASRLNISLSGLASGAEWISGVLYASDGQSLLYWGEVDGLRQIDLPAGTYYLDLNRNSAETGYQLSASATALSIAGGTDAKPKALGALGSTPVSISSEVFRTGAGSGAVQSTDYYSFTLASASEVKLNMTGVSVLSDTQVPGWRLQVFDSSGALVGQGSATDDQAVTPVLAAGTYKVAVDAGGYNWFGAAAVRYTLAASASALANDKAGNSLATAGALPSLTASPALVASDWVGIGNAADYYRFTLTAADRVAFELDANGAADFAIVDSNGTVIASDTSSNPTQPAALASPLAAGTYYLRVNGSTGTPVSYTITGQQGAFPDGTAGHATVTASALQLTSVRQTVSDWVGRGASEDYYAFTVPNGAAPVNFWLSSAGDWERLTLSILSADDLTAISRTDYYPVISRPSETRSLQPGKYYIRVSSDAVSSPYSLTYWSGTLLTGSSSVDGAGNLVTAAKSLGTLGTTPVTAADWVGSQDAADFYKFTLTEASSVRFGVGGGTELSVGLYGLTLYNADGNPLGDIVSSAWVYGTENVTTRELDAGTYFVAVTTSQSGFGYGLTLAATPTQHPAGDTLANALDLGVNPGVTSISDAIIGFRTEYVHFSLTSATYVDLTLSVAATAFFSAMLKNANGEYIINTQFHASPTSPGRYGAVLAAGDYYVEVRGSSDVSQPYTLLVAPLGVSVSAPVLGEGNSGSASLVYTVTLSAASVLPVSMTYATSDNTATAGSDYTAASGTLTIAAGQTTGTIVVPVSGDKTYEGNETVKLTLSNLSGATFATGGATLTAIGTLTNDDAPPVATLSAPAVQEGNSGTAALVYTVTLSAASGLDATFTYAASNGTATAGTDYTGATGTLTIAAGQTTGTITIPVMGDTTYEADEALTLTLSNPTGATFAGGAATLSAVGTLLNDDAPPVATLSAPSVLEGNSGTAALVYTVTLSAASGLDATFTYAASNGTATAGTDYTATTGTLTIAAGQTTGTITIPVIGDTTYEADEALTLTLSNPTGATFAGGAATLSAIGTLLNDDVPPVATLSAPSVLEGNSGTTALVYTVTLSAASGLDAVFTYATSDGTATAGTDYTAATGTLVIAAGQTTGTITVAAKGDTTYENNETATLTLSNPTGATFAGGATTLTSIGTLTNDDAPPVATLSAPSVVEGNSGTTTLVFTVTLSAASALPTAFTYATSNGTAASSSDYKSATGTLTIAAGQTSGKINVVVNGDKTYESNETLKLTLSKPVGASFAGNAASISAVGTIRNDDTPPVATLSAPAVVEGNSGTAALVYTVTLSATSALDAVFTYATSDGTATAGTDYTAATGTLTIAAGRTTGTITVAVKGDTTYESNETAKLTLSNPTGATFAGGATTLTAIGTLTNDDAPPVATLSAASVLEGNSGTAALVYTVTLSAASALDSVFTYAASSGTATAGTDYTAATGTLTIAAGQTTGTITIPVMGDTTYEADEALTLTLSNPTGATFAGGAATLSAVGTLLNDDAPPVATLSAASVLEGNSGTTALVYTVTLSAASGLDATFTYATSNGTATAGTDYTAATGTLIIAAGQTTGTITIPVIGDTTYEADEALTLTLSNPTGATFAGGAATLSAIGTLLNDDAPPVATLSAPSVVEGNSGTTELVYTVTLSAASGLDATFTYAASDGAATAGTDYTAATGTLTIAAGQTTGTITIPVIGDTTYEADEALTLTLSNPTGATFADGATTLSAIGTLLNDDAPPVATLSAPSVLEGDAGTAALVYTVTLSAASALDATFTYATSDGTATAGTDYTAATGTLIIAAGQTTGTITVAAKGDTTSEADETVILTLSNPGGATFANGATSLSSAGTIRNDDTNVLATLSSATVVEGNSGTTNLEFVVTLSAATAKAVTFAYATANGTAVAGSDYTAASGTLTIAAGQTTGRIRIAVTGESTYEANETLKLTLSKPVGASFANGATSLSATGTITNDDKLPTATISDVSVLEGNGGTANLVFTVNLSAASYQTTTFAYATSDITAAAGTDYKALTGTLTIAAGKTQGTITVAVAGDTVVEANEALTLTLSKPSGAVFAGGATSIAATGTVLNDDFTLPAVSVSSTAFQIIDGTAGTPAPDPVALSSLVRIDLQANDAIARYEIIDTNQAATSATLSVNGSVKAGGVITLTPAEFAQTAINAGTSGSTDTLMLRATGNAGSSGWKPIMVSTSVSGAPVLDVSDKTLLAKTAVAVTSLAPVQSSVPIAAYQFMDMTPDAESGSFSVGGATQSPFTTIDVLASQLASTSFLTGAAGRADDIWVRASNGTNWSNWSQVTVTASTLVASR